MNALDQALAGLFAAVALLVLALVVRGCLRVHARLQRMQHWTRAVDIHGGYRARLNVDAQAVKPPASPSGVRSKG